jgi:cobalt transporter subunit CbtB
MCETCPPSGVTGNRRDMMTTKTITQTPVDTSFIGISSAALAGVVLLFAAGFAQASVMHDSAHDTRHAIAFPCH